MLAAATFWETSNFRDLDSPHLTNDAFKMNSHVIEDQTKYFLEFCGVENVCGTLTRVVRDRDFHERAYRWAYRLIALMAIHT